MCILCRHKSQNLQPFILRELFSFYHMKLEYSSRMRADFDKTRNGAIEKHLVLLRLNCGTIFLEIEFGKKSMMGQFFFGSNLVRNWRWDKFFLGRIIFICGAYFFTLL